jgi:short-subunit dehydrogenase
MTKTVLDYRRRNRTRARRRVCACRTGHRVIASGETRPQVWELRQEAKSRGVDMQVIKFDVANENDHTHALAHDVDVLLNNTVIMEPGPLVEIPMRDSDASISFGIRNERVRSARGRTGVRARDGRARARPDRLDVLGCDLIKVPFDGGYAASKHAVEGICSAIEEELKAYGVEVVTINPDAYRTGFNDTDMERMNQWREHCERMMAH